MVKIISTAAILATAALLLLGAYLARRRGISLSRIARPAALALAAAAFLRLFAGEVAMHETQGLNMYYTPFGDAGLDVLRNVGAVLLIWFSYAAVMATVMAEFFPYRTLRAVVNLFALPVFALSVIFFDLHAIGVLDAAGYSLANPRLWLMMLECALGLAIPLSHLLYGEGYALPRGKRGWVRFAVTILGALIAIMPHYVPQFFLGARTGLVLEDLTEAHRFAIYFAIIIPLLLFHALKNEAQDVKRLAMIYLSLSLVWTSFGYWNLSDFMSPTSLPLHLCNLAMFLIPLCLIFRMNRLFYFTLFINVLGALIAMAMPNMGGDALSSGVVFFWINHYAAFFMPILFVALGLFERPKFKQWIWSSVALTVYFVLILIVNAWFSNYGEVDFFFLNSDFVVSQLADMLGDWVKGVMSVVWSFEVGTLTFTFYPVFQLIYYVVYIGLTAGMWFIYSLLFTAWDAAEDRRQREKDYKRMKKELNEYLGGRSIHEPVGGDASPRLTLSHFSKRYGANAHYSVNDVSFDVRGGEIFGFLGPNGAGKSTIIKSIVGIQTITSGDIEICGYNVDKQPVQAKLHTGFVPDHYALYENLTGREYINYIADLFQVNFTYRDRIIEKLVERFQLTGSFDNQMKTYSHGMKQKITIMAALVHNPAVWILDEPLTGLDPTSIHEVKECMREHAAAGNIVFFSSHIIDVVEKICDRIAIIKKGKLRACVSIKELEEKGTNLEQFYLDVIGGSDDEHAPYVAPVEEAKRV